MIRRFLLASALATAVLFVVNLFVFPLVFGAGVPVPYASESLRAAPLIGLHAVALVATGLLLTAVIGRGVTSIGGASLSGALAGLLASLPSALHMLAMVDVSATSQIAPVAWTAATWGFAGSTIGAVYGRPRPA